MKTPDKKTITYFIALLVPPLGAYLAVDMRHKWRHLCVITLIALLTMLFYPLGLAFAILIIHTQMPDDDPAPSEKEGAHPEPVETSPLPSGGDNAAALQQPIPGLPGTGDDQVEEQPTPQPIPGLPGTGDDTTGDTKGGAPANEKDATPHRRETTRDE